MRPERINAIFNQIAEKYAGHRLSHQMVESMYKDISAVLRGLHKTENFLNASVDSGKKIIIVEDEMQVVFLSPIAGKQASVEQGGGLVVVHASAVDIVDVETDAEPFVGIDGKVGLEPFFTAPVVEAFVIGEVGEG